MSKGKINIAVFTINWLGVSETFIYRQLKALDDNGFNAFILTTNLIESFFSKKDNNRIVYWKKPNRINRKWSTFKQVIGLGKNSYAATNSQNNFWSNKLKLNKAKLIHAHYGPGGLMILNVAQKLNIPLITTFHGYDASTLLRKKVYLNNLKLLFKYSYVITVSNFMRKRLISLGAPEDRIITHYIGTDLNKFQFQKHISIDNKAKNNQPLVFLQVSNFVQKKGHEYTIKAFNLFLEEYPNSKLILAGDGPRKIECEALVESIKIEDKVKFLGAINPDEVTQWMSKSDVFLHHSVTDENGGEEGIPTVIMEAMASGIPVVSSFHAGIPELIKNNESGFLIKEKDVLGYSKLLIKLLKTNTDIITEKAASQVAEKFDIHKQNQLLITIYENIINNNLFLMSNSERKNKKL